MIRFTEPWGKERYSNLVKVPFILDFASRMYRKITNITRDSGWRSARHFFLTKAISLVVSFMEEVIVVKSRPTWSFGKRNGSVGRRSTIIQKGIGGIPAILADGRHKVKMEVTTINNESVRMSRLGKVGVLAHKPPKTFNIYEPSGSILFNRSNESLPLFFAGIGNTCLGCSESKCEKRVRCWY